MYLFINIVLFISTQIYLNHRGIPKLVDSLKFRYVVLLSILVLSLTVVIGLLLNIGVVLVVSITAIISSIMLFSYQKKMEEVERRMSR